jgi:hypothetical protein
MRPPASAYGLAGDRVRNRRDRTRTRLQHDTICTNKCQRLNQRHGPPAHSSFIFARSQGIRETSNQPSESGIKIRIYPTNIDELNGSGSRGRPLDPIQSTADHVDQTASRHRVRNPALLPYGGRLRHDFDWLELRLQTRKLRVINDGLHYGWASSGIFVEALSLAKIVIVPEGTWMAWQAARFDARYVVFRDWNAQSVAGAIYSALDTFASLSQKDVAVAPAWLRIHSRSNYVDRLFGAVGQAR